MCQTAARLDDSDEGSSADIEESECLTSCQATVIGAVNKQDAFPAINFYHHGGLLVLLLVLPHQLRDCLNTLTVISLTRPLLL